ncbi:MAG: hypothetical protein LBC48_03245 [Dysgonamonadaceae bacterium]|jgi:hypothetical protein|nr:hypothetical protein [Dysgonamonadaceae bacterium]
MKTTVKIKLLLLCLYLFPNLQAQVTIGMVEIPAEGALLQLKNKVEATPGGENADKGLLLSRVNLSDYTTLDPVVTGTPSDEEKKKHIGLIVYNLTEDAGKKLTKGLVVWNGKEWNSIANKEMANVKKNLYNAKEPEEDRSVSFQDLIEVRMGKGYYQNEHFGYPEFKGGKGPYKYHFTQYWRDGNTIGYSNDVKLADNNQQNYQPFMNGNYMSPIERNEVWMYEAKTNKIFHIQFFIMGENEISTTKVYAILVEQF